MAVESYLGYATSLTVTDADGDSLEFDLSYDSESGKRIVPATDGSKVNVSMALLKLSYTDVGENGTFVTADDLKEMSKYFGGLADAMKVSEKIEVIKPTRGVRR